MSRTIIKFWWCAEQCVPWYCDMTYIVTGVMVFYNRRLLFQDPMSARASSKQCNMAAR